MASTAGIVPAPGSSARAEPDSPTTRTPLRKSAPGKAEGQTEEKEDRWPTTDAGASKIGSVPLFSSLFSPLFQDGCP